MFLAIVAGLSGIAYGYLLADTLQKTNAKTTEKFGEFADPIFKKQVELRKKIEDLRRQNENLRRQL